MKQILRISHIIIALLFVSSIVALPGQKDDRHKNPLSVVGAGNALSFDGVDDYVSVPHNSSLNFSTAVTLEAWLKTTGTSEEYILTKGEGSFYLGINVGSVGLPSVYLAGINDISGWLYATETVTDGKWHHIAATYDGSNERIYVDGKLEGTIAYSGTIDTTGDPMYIGVRGGSAQKYFSGVIDEVRIWNVAHTTQQIRESMHLQLNGNETGLVGYWRFDEGTGITTYDATSNSKDDTLRNGPAWVPSTAPFGPGTSASLFSFTDGTDTLGSLILSTVSPFPNPLDITVTQITAPPDSLPVGSSTILGDRYWVIDTFTVVGPALQSTAKSLLHPGRKQILDNPLACLNLTFSVPQSFTNGGAANPSLYTLYSRGNNADGQWSTELSGASGLTATDVTFNCTTAYEQLALGTDDALPIQFAMFNASVVGDGKVQLEWTTISETNNYGFYVERRPKTGTTFTTVSDLIPGAGTSLVQHRYEWTDKNVGPASYVYRLTQVDMNGHASYSGEIVVAGVTGVTGESAPRVFQLVQNYPNPFNPTTTVSFVIGHSSFVTLRVYDVLGREVATLVNGMEDGGWKSVVWDASNVPSGLYFCRLTAESFVEMKKMVLMK